MFSALSVPSFLTLPCVGLDISDTSLKYIEVGGGQVSNQQPLKQWGDINIPAGVLQRGDILDPKQLTNILKECKELTQSHFVRVSLPEEKAYIFETEIRRNTPAKDIRSLLEFRLAENVPLQARDVYFDYAMLPSEHEQDRTIKIVVTAYAREIIQTYFDVCVAAKLQPLSFEVEAQAMARSTIATNTTGAVMLVDFGKTRTGVGIIYNDTLMYTSTIDVGGDQLSMALRKQLGEDVAEKELTRLKNTEGLVHGATSSLVHDAVLSTMSVIRDELATHMQYWHMRSNNAPERRLSQIIMCGGSANLKGLPAYFTQSLGVPVIRGNVWEHLYSFEDIIPPIDKRHSLGYATAVGLALGSYDA